MPLMQAVRFYSPSLLRSAPGSSLLIILHSLVDSEVRKGATDSDFTAELVRLT